MDQNTSKSSPFSEIEDHQEELSEQIEKPSLIHKVRDLIAGKEPFVIGISFAVISIVVIGSVLLFKGAGQDGGAVSGTPTPTIEATPTEEATVTSIEEEPTVRISRPQPTKTLTPSPSPSSIIPTSTITSPPLPTQTPTTADSQPPTTNITYPQQNGEITYFTDLKVCVIMTAPTDNVSGATDITTYFAYDTDGYSSVKSTGYLCKSPLLNGPHTLRYKSQDKAGNTETERTLSFTVNIPGNVVPTATPTPGPRVTYSPTSIDFGTKDIGTATQQQIQISNVGPGVLTISSVALSNVPHGACSGAFVVNFSSGSLAEGGVGSIPVDFNPTANACTYEANITIHSNGQGSPHTVVVTGKSN